MGEPLGRELHGLWLSTPCKFSLSRRPSQSRPTRSAALLAFSSSPSLARLVLLDGLEQQFHRGTPLFDCLLDHLLGKGLEVLGAAFRPTLRIARLAGLELELHRRLLVADGVGFVLVQFFSRPVLFFEFDIAIVLRRRGFQARQPAPGVVRTGRPRPARRTAALLAPLCGAPCDGWSGSGENDR
jgi:hypothetical protein